MSRNRPDHIGPSYSLHPLADALGFTVGEVAKLLGVGHTRRLTEREADVAAVVLAKAHPFELWPEMIDHVIDDCSRLCGACGQPFIPELCSRFGRRTVCSEDCAADLKRQRVRQGARRRRGVLDVQSCRWCGATFPTHHDRRYCSEACRTLALRRQKRDIARRIRERKRSQP